MIFKGFKSVLSYLKAFSYKNEIFSKFLKITFKNLENSIQLL